MRGFVTIDRQLASDEVAVWVTALTEGRRAASTGGEDDEQPDTRQTEAGPADRGAASGRAAQVNAVVVNVETDPDAMYKVRMLTRQAAVVATSGSDLADFPLDVPAHSVDELAALVDQSRMLQKRIHDAVGTYAQRFSKRTGEPLKPRNVVYPSFPPEPTPEQFAAEADTPPQRALATARYIAAAWNFWLETDEERRRRTVSPKGITPWMMPPELGGERLEILPVEFAASLRIESPAVGDWSMLERTAHDPVGAGSEHGDA